MPAVPKPSPKLKKKPKPLRYYREREPVTPIRGALFPKPQEYDKRQDELNRARVIKRDKGICRWCELRLGKITRGSTPHHINGRRRNWSEKGQVTLCFRHHEAFHKALPDENGIRITKEALLDLMEEIYATASHTA